MKVITVRNIPEDLARELEMETRRRGLSLNRTVVELLKQGLGLESGRPSNGLRRLSGSWTDEDLAEFQAAVAVFEQIDEDVWK